MKTLIISLLGCFILSSVQTQTPADPFIKEAQDLLIKKEYKLAQLSLQDAINEINNLISAQIAASIPDEINGLKSSGNNSNTGASGMFGGGFQISKSYKNAASPWNEAELNIMANSPMLATLSMYMTNPAIMGPEYKSVRVGTQRAILKTEMEDYYADNGNTKSIRSSELQIPLNQTLITIYLKGFESEQAELAFANQIGVDKLKAALGE